MNDAIPPGTLPLSARAPGKCIAFGEHAVVHGAPEVVFAVDLHTQVLVRPAAAMSLNGDREATDRNPYFRAAVERCWPDGSPLEVRAVSRIPRAAGLGSSAAFVAALATALRAARGGVGRAELAQLSYEIERTAQGVGSAGDTTAAVGGGYLVVNGGDGPAIWTVNGPEQRWEARRIADPGWVWVVCFSGIPRSTASAVRAVTARLERPDGPRLLDEFKGVAAAGLRAIEQEDRRSVAELLSRNQELLRTVGVSHPRLEALLEAAAPAAEGAKLTGAGAGGSILVLPQPGKEAELVRRLARAGGLAYVVRAAPEGVALVEDRASS